MQPKPAAAKVSNLTLRRQSLSQMLRIPILHHFTIVDMLYAAVPRWLGIFYELPRSGSSPYFKPLRILENLGDEWCVRRSCFVATLLLLRDADDRTPGAKASRGVQVKGQSLLAGYPTFCYVAPSHKRAADNSSEHHVSTESVGRSVMDFPPILQSSKAS